MIEFSTWMGVLAYSIGAGLAVIWVGISIANWAALHSAYSIVLGFSAVSWILFFVALGIIASDILPSFSGVYVALSIRLSALMGVLSLALFTYICTCGKNKSEKYVNDYDTLGEWDDGDN